MAVEYFMDMDKPLMLSVYIPVYNHEKYIAKALDSVLMQKTQYRYEVLVGEDCSTDGSADILREYEKKYPGRFTVFYREKNMYHSIPSNEMDLVMRCRGKYMICLEGDDYWLDENKLEKQITFLETHPEYSVVAHNCIVVDQDDKPTGEHYPECKKEEYTIRDYQYDILPGQTATKMVRNGTVFLDEDRSFLMDGFGPGDRREDFYYLCTGKIFCIQEVMSAYRHVIHGGESYSATHKNQDFSFRERYEKCFLDYSRKYGQEIQKCEEFRYGLVIMMGLQEKQIKLKEALAFSKCLHHRGIILVKLLCFYMKRKLHIIPTEYLKTN